MKNFKQYLTEQKSQNTEIKCDINGICKKIRTYESAGNEEKILGVYKDVKGLPTIGHGHLVTPKSESVFAEVFPEEHKKDPSFGKTVLSGKGRLTSDQAEKLLQRDVRARLPEVKKLVPKFEELSGELQGELTSEHFRGMLGKSKKTLEHINKGQYDEASKEFLNAKDYRESVAQKTGVAKRMENLSTALKKEAELQKKRLASQTTQAPAQPAISQTAPSR